MIEDLLEQERAQGEFHSSGEFTVDLVAAADKLGRRRIATPGLYVLKILQAGVRAECERLEVRVGRETVEVRLLSPLMRHLSLPRLLSQLRNPLEAAADPALSHLAVGLTAALATSPAETRFGHWSRGRGWLLRFTREQQRLDEWDEPPWDPEQDGCLFRLRRERFSGGFLRWVKRLVAGTSAEHHLVSSRGMYSPVPILLDGRPLRPPGLGKVGGEGSAGYQPPARIIRPSTGQFHLVERYLTGSWRDPGVMAGPRLGSRRALYNRRGGEFSQQSLKIGQCSVILCEANPAPKWFAGKEPGKLPGHSPTPCHAMLAVPLRLRGSGRLTLVRDGIILEELAVDLGCPGALAVVSAEQLDLDLSGLRVVRNECFEELVGSLARAISKMIKTAIPYLRKSFSEHPRLLAYLERTLPYVQGTLHKRGRGRPERRKKKHRGRPAPRRTWAPEDRSKFHTQRRQHRNR